MQKFLLITEHKKDVPISWSLTNLRTCATYPTIDVVNFVDILFQLGLLLRQNYQRYTFYFVCYAVSRYAIYLLFYFSKKQEAHV